MKQILLLPLLFSLTLGALRSYCIETERYVAKWKGGHFRWSSNGEKLYITQRAGDLAVAERDKAELRTIVHGFGVGINGFALSYNSKWAVVQYDGNSIPNREDRGAVISDVERGTSIQRLRLPYAQFSAMAFSPDDKYLAAAWGGVIVIWETTKWTEIGRLTGDFGKNHPTNYNFRFTRDGTQIVAGYGAELSDSFLLVWDVAEKKVIKNLGARGKPIAAALSRDGKYYAAGGKAATKEGDDRAFISFWHTDTWVPALHIPLTRGQVHALDFSAENHYIVAAGSVGFRAGLPKNELFVIDTKTGEVQARFEIAVSDLAFSPDCKTLALSRDDKIYLYDFAKLLAGEYPDAQPVKE